MKLNTILVDDSTMQREAIANLIKGSSELQLVAQYSNALEAKKGLKKHNVDLLFLDIEMPVLNGFDLLESLQDIPQVIVITGKVEYALKAFDYNVTDYLHKPINRERFFASVNRAVENYKLKHNIQKEDDNFIFVKSNLKNLKIHLNAIKWVEALGDYIKLVTDEGNVITLSTMKSFEQELPTDKFMRIHKSYIVNLEKISNFNSKFVEIDKEQIPISRNKKQELAEAISSSNV
ncbi:LytR/AlgR family response regulator transcription factor [Zhouia sp. PK063]|uniref:LytR/AlgR family response regulator transcription factor n=1 Tax=Zhouia sp. PK063 TaxID=3373602 RepID=UPI0037979F22